MLVAGQGRVRTVNVSCCIAGQWGVAVLNDTAPSAPASDGTLVGGGVHHCHDERALGAWPIETCHGRAWYVHV